MTDLSMTIAPKSDQMNADDLIGGPRTIRVTSVKLGDSPDQPISIHYEGDGGKPYKPCKSMRRVLVHIWGKDGNAYPGRGMTLFRDPGVQFGGLAVGGIRISHMTGIDQPVTMALTATRANRKPYTVKPLADAGGSRVDAAREAIAGAPTVERLDRLWAHRDMAPFQDELRADYDARRAELTPADPPRDPAPQTDGDDYVGV